MKERKKRHIKIFYGENTYSLEKQLKEFLHEYDHGMFRVLINASTSGFTIGHSIQYVLTAVYELHKSCLE